MPQSSNSCINLWVNRDNYRETKATQTTIPELEDGQILVSIDKFGLTANNVSYAVSGDMVGYWNFFPTSEDRWGTVPVWGCANVIQSQNSEISVGERLWGYFPMSSHLVLSPGNVSEMHFLDQAEHRQALPGLYNIYSRSNAEAQVLQDMENERCLFFPLFATSYILSDYLIDNNFFGAEQVLIGSASSKTGFGLAKILHDDDNVSAKIVGLTSAGNVDFVERLECCDQIVVYGNEDEVDTSLAAAYVDMSGNIELTTTLHTLLGENMLESAMVGASHWDKRGRAGELPGAKPTFFFAPAQIEKRDKDWGPGVAWQKAMQAGVKVSAAIKNEITIEWLTGTDELAEIWEQMLDNKIPPSRGLMVSLLE